MKIIRLSESDYQLLLMMLGMATGAAGRDGGEIPVSLKRLVDWVITQGGSPDSYTYWTDKKTIADLKEAEILLEGKS